MATHSEETSSLSEETVQSIMQNETAVVLPCVKPLPTDPSDEYLLVLRNLGTSQEYMYPEPVTSLNNWHCFFLDCPLMKGLDFVSNSFKFPEITGPPSHDVAVLTRTFTLQSKAFKLTVVRAPPSSDSSVIFYALTLRDLPVQHAVYESALLTSAKRKACLNQYAMLAMLEAKGVQVISAAKGMPEVEEHMIQQLSLEHGSHIFQGVGTKAYQVSGWFEMHERECTAASCSLPLLLKHLYALQFALCGPLHYHIIAPNKYAYMVWLRNLGGLEVYYQVNMNASLAAMQNAFSVSGAPSPGGGLISSFSAPATITMVQQTMLLETIQRQMQKHQGTSNPQDMAEEEFVSYMKYNGLDLLLKTITETAVHQKRVKDTQMAKKVLEALLTSYTTSTLQVSQEMCLKSLGMAFMGLLSEVWENLGDMNEEKKPEALVRLLSKTYKDVRFLRPKDALLMPVLIRGCLNCSPYKWWERFVSLCDVHEEESEKAILICASILYHGNKYKALFPRLFTTYFSPSWETVVETACAADKELGNLKEAYEALLSDKGTIKKIVQSDENARKLYYIRALAYLMLQGDAVKRLQELKIY